MAEGTESGHGAAILTKWGFTIAAEGDDLLRIFPTTQPDLFKIVAVRPGAILGMFIEYAPPVAKEDRELLLSAIAELVTEAKSSFRVGA